GTRSRSFSRLFKGVAAYGLFDFRCQQCARRRRHRGHLHDHAAWLSRGAAVAGQSNDGHDRVATGQEGIHRDLALRNAAIGTVLSTNHKLEFTNLQCHRVVKFVCTLVLLGNAPCEPAQLTSLFMTGPSSGSATTTYDATGMHAI